MEIVKRIETKQGECLREVHDIKIYAKESFKHIHKDSLKTS